MIGQLLKPLKANLLRYSGEGYYDDNYNYVPSTKQTIEIELIGGISPYRDGRNTFTTPTGVRSTDSRVVRSTTKFIVGDEQNDTVADELVIDGDVFYCVDMASHEGHTDLGFQNIPDHYEGLFYRKDEV